MSVIRITCPACNFSREYEVSAIPSGMPIVTCPKCRNLFTFDAAASTPLAGEQGVEQSESSDSPYDGTTAQHSGTAQPPPADGEPPPSATGTPARPHRSPLTFTFDGNARDYFGIWIVNTLFKIVTCGIYSAWAKVRTRRYFYGNTTLNDTPFEYLADPLALFKGWLIAALFFVLYSVATKVNPTAGSLMSIVLFLLVPWLIVRSRMFNLRYSAHRNICFSFAPNYREAYLVYAWLPCLLPFTLGLIAPYLVYRQKKFLVENSGYGRTRCTFEATARDFYLVFLKGFGWLIVSAALFGFIVSLIAGIVGKRHWDSLLNVGHGAGTRLLTLSLLILTVVIPFLYLFSTIYMKTALGNLTWNATRIKNSRFSSTLKVGPMAWLYLSSAAGILLSFGLLVPWAAVRLARYRFENLSLELRDDEEAFLGWGQRPIGSTGEEIGDMFGIDIGL